MVKVLSKVLFFVCLLGGLYSQAMGLEAQIEREYAAFQGRRIPDVADQPCKAVQFIYHLQENAARDGNAARKIALIIGSGVGVGGISENEATPAERALMVRGLNFAVRQKVKEDGFNLYFKGGDDSVGQHQTIVARLIESSQRIQGSRLNNVRRSPNYDNFAPQAPVFHPYDSDFHPFIFSVETKLAMATTRPLLPIDIQNSMNGVPDDQIDMFFIAQQKIPGGAQNTLFRPHSWVSPTGEAWGASVWARFSQAPYGVTLTKNYETTQDVSVHDGVSSPDNFSIEHILPKPFQSSAFWSLCRNPVDGRFALTLHWILEGDDPQDLWNIVDDLPGGTIGALSNRIAAHHSLKNLYSSF